MTLLSSLKKLDWALWLAAIGIVLLGIAAFSDIGPRSQDFVNRQVVFIIVGTVLMVLASFFDYRILKNYSAASVAIYAIAIILLFITLASAEIRGVNSWIIFRGLTFEPSEFAKLAVLILLAKYFSQKHVEIYRTKHILASGFYVLIPAGLTLLQPDLGSTIVFISLWIAMLLFAGIKRKHLLAIIMIGTVLTSFAWFFVFETYQRNRIISFIDPYLDPRGSGYNTLQSQITFGSGQMFGTFFEEKDTHSPVLVPEPYNDFAFAAFAKRFGFAGVALLLAIFLFLIFRIGSIATRTNNNFAKLFSLGFITIIFTHFLINAGMNLGISPITGIPFSFLSYGGSHLVTLMIGLGIIQSIRIRSRIQS
ncbi:MAG: FtsW/RodA/SpoVE family cell cycle protein [Candidatus Paceibacterota bacterium]